MTENPFSFVTDDGASKSYATIFYVYLYTIYIFDVKVSNKEPQFNGSDK